MNLIDKIVNLVRKKLSSQFVRNISWLGISEVVPRLVRLGVTVILARYLTSKDYGLGAIVLTVSEIVSTFADVGIISKIIQADEEDLDTLCISAYWLNWIIFLGLFVIQCIAAFPVSWFYNSPELILPICIAAIPHLIWPTIAIQFALVNRENRLKVRAVNKIIHHTVGNLSSGLFAFLGLGVWAFVLPAIVVIPIDVITYYTCHSWRPSSGITTKYWKELWTFGRNIFGVALLKTLRNNLDYLIVGRFLGIKELGIYFFGFNAGLGISLSVINALNGAIYPHLCAARSDWFQFKQRYWSSVKAVCFIIIPLVLLQSSLAPFYVPVVFGQKWVVAIPILVLICLSAIPRAFADTASQLLVAIGKPDLDLRWNVVFTFVFAMSLLVGAHWQSMGVARAVLLIHIICMPLFALWATRYVFTRSKNCPS